MPGGRSTRNQMPPKTWWKRSNPAELEIFCEKFEAKPVKSFENMIFRRSLFKKNSALRANDFSGQPSCARLAQTLFQRTPERGGADVLEALRALRGGVGPPCPPSNLKGTRNTLGFVDWQKSPDTPPKLLGNPLLFVGH